MNDYQTRLRHHQRIVAAIMATTALAFTATGCTRPDVGASAQPTAPAPSATQTPALSSAPTLAPTSAATASEAATSAPAKAQAAQAKAKTALEAAAKNASSAATTVSRDVAGATATPEGDPTS